MLYGMSFDNLKVYELTFLRLQSIGWLVVLRINVDLAIFQSYLDLEAGDYQILKIQSAINKLIT